jgi:hypothetical protein
MKAQDYATVILAVSTIIGGVFGGMKWMIKHYLWELRPNSGSSLKDAVTRLEQRVDDLYKLMVEK